MVKRSNSTPASLQPSQVDTSDLQILRGRDGRDGRDGQDGLSGPRGLPGLNGDTELLEYKETQEMLH